MSGSEVSTQGNWDRVAVLEKHEGTVVTVILEQTNSETT
jgi:hypothetical protein